MRRAAAFLLVTAGVAFPCLGADEDKWTTVKGRVVFDDAKRPIPKRVFPPGAKGAALPPCAAKDKEFLTEDWIVNPKTKGVKNVVVWLGPEPPAGGPVPKNLPPFDKTDIHPALANPAQPTVEMDQPCCRFIPHILAAREGQVMIIKNSAAFPHNAKWGSLKNGEINPLIPAGGEYKVEKPLVAERHPIRIDCSIHPWMNARVWVFSHPYFAVTDEDGKFEIKNAPVMGGKLRLVTWHEAGVPGDWRLGESITVKAGETDLKDIKLTSSEK